VLSYLQDRTVLTIADCRRVSKFVICKKMMNHNLGISKYEPVNMCHFNKACASQFANQEEKCDFNKDA
jgi:hypothetical protein